MFKKAFALASLTALTAVVASSMMAGCSSTTETVTPPPSGSDPDGGDGGNTPPRPGDSGSTADSCYDDTAAQALPASFKPNPGGACTDAQVASFLDNCIGDTGSDAACKDAMEGDNAACAQCMLPLQGSTSIPAMLLLGQSVKLNVEACIAVAMGHPECALIATNQTYCLDSSCGECDSSDEAATKACESEAAQDICSDFFTEGAVPAGCAEAFQALTDDDPAIKACLGDATDFFAAAKLHGHVLCVEGTGGGTTDPDAGADPDAGSDPDASQPE